jgi:HD-GYP domain-containing protein (c-di-GMP phosphodiesterase class II)
MKPAGKNLISDFNEEQLRRLEAVYENVSPFREFEVAGLEEIVANFLVTFRREANILKMISPVKSHSEHTCTHAMNVAVLSMSQAEYLGLNDDLIHAIGVAGLMHDVGKLFIPKKVLHKDGRLSKEESVTVNQHTLLGAAYLLKVEGIVPLAPIVALEHHRRYDGSGYPVLIDNGRRQHVASQIVAVADFFDVLRNNRPRHTTSSTEEILYMMKQERGFFNPILLDNFSMILQRGLT